MLEVARSDRTITGTANVAAGGWYRLRCAVEGTRVEWDPGRGADRGVGEVFVIAGQSYAAGANDALLRVNDPEGQVVAYDLAAKTWRVAHDPQPAVGDGGTIWPAFGDVAPPWFGCRSAWSTSPSARPRLGNGYRGRRFTGTWSLLEKPWVGSAPCFGNKESRMSLRRSPRRPTWRIF